MYPGTNKPPTVLSNEIHCAATFVKLSHKEYLAAARYKDGCLHLWNIESKASKKVFDPKLPKKYGDREMVIFRINENTTGYAEDRASSDGSRRVFILKMDKEKWSLSATLRLFTASDILDVCYVKVADGTPCLLLCVSDAQYVMAVEMIGGRTRWEAGKQQMGEKFYPCSICTDDDNTVYVADYSQNMMHLLSADDGSIIRSIFLPHYKIVNPFTVKFHGQYLFVEHYRKPGEVYAISKIQIQQ